jgi:hypothetical protein
MIKKITAKVPNNIKSNLLKFVPGDAKKKYHKLRIRILWEIGKRTPYNRVLPDFLIIGAQKAGTSSMFKLLHLHPQIYGSIKKEPHFFDANYSKGVNWYRSHFPMRQKIKKGCVTGEASPCYLMFPHAAERISQLLPNIKLIVLLRNPVDRAISHYFHVVSGNRESLSIEEAFKAEDDRIRPELKRLQEDKTYYSIIYRTYSYKKRGVYIDQIKHYLQFFNREQLFIIKSEEYFENPNHILKSVYAFLGVDDNFIPRDSKPKRIGDYSGRQFDAVKQNLQEYFTPHNKKLYEFLGGNFNW